MKVFYDLVYFSLGEFGGISRMWMELFRQLPGSKVEPTFLVRPNINIAQDFIEENNYFDAAVIREDAKGFLGKLGKLGFWRNMLLMGRTWRLRNAVFHSTDYINPLIKPRNLRIVTTIHDMVFLDQKDRFAMNIWYWDKVWSTYHSLRVSDAVVSVSETTRQRIMHYYPWAKDKIHVIYHGIDKSFHIDEPREKKEKRFIFLGGRNTYKNYDLLVEAFAKFVVDYPDWTLHVAGSNTYAESRNLELEKYRSLGIESKVVDHGLVEQTTLVDLLAGSSALVIPSLNEGFNFPLLEGMAVGTQVLSSNIPVSLELAEGYATFFDPASVDSLLMAMRNVAEKPLSRKQLVRCMDYAQSFTWEESFAKLCRIYEDVLK